MSGNGVPATAAVLKQQAAQMQEVFHALQAYEDSDAQRWAEIDEIKRMVADLNTTIVATTQEWKTDRTELANKLAESEGMRKQLQAQIAALEQAAESRARALQQAQSTATAEAERSSNLEAQVAKLKKSLGSKSGWTHERVRQLSAELEHARAQLASTQKTSTAEVERQLAQGRVAQAEAERLGSAVHKLQAHYSVVRKKLQRANDRLKRQHRDMRQSRQTAKDLAAQVRNIREQSDAAMVQARQEHAKREQEIAFQLKQEVALREAAEAKLVEAYRNQKKLRHMMKDRDTLQETLDVVYGGASAAMVDEFCDEQMERKRNTTQDDRTAQPQDDAKEHVARAHAAAAASRTQQRTQHSAAAHTSDGNRQALGHAGLGDAPSSSRDAVSRVPKAVQELDALLASVDAAASVAGEVAAARAQRGLDRSAAAAGGGGGGGNRKTAAARGPPALRGRGSGSHDVSPRSTLHSRGSSDGDISDNGVGSHRATARARESLSIYAQPMLSR